MYIKYNKAKNYILCEMIINKQIVNNLCVYIAIYTKCVQFARKRSSYKGRMVNALASGADEGRDKLR